MMVRRRQVVASNEVVVCEKEKGKRERDKREGRKKSCAGSS
jgi:hypothetical protein